MEYFKKIRQYPHWRRILVATLIIGSIHAIAVIVLSIPPGLAGIAALTTELVIVFRTTADPELRERLKYSIGLCGAAFFIGALMLM